MFERVTAASSTHLFPILQMELHTLFNEDNHCLHHSVCTFAVNVLKWCCRRSNAVLWVGELSGYPVVWSFELFSPVCLHICSQISINAVVECTRQKSHYPPDNHHASHL